MDQNLIKTLLDEFLTHLGVTYEGIAVTDRGGSTLFTIKTAESGKLIGTHGETLSALNHLIKKIYEEKMRAGGTASVDAHFTVDINGYQAERIHTLEGEAHLLAERARTFRYDIEMSPMSSYERMIVHATLKGVPDIETTSVGEGKMRHIVVRYKDPTAPTAAVTESPEL